jgi:hypothetical protein
MLPACSVRETCEAFADPILELLALTGDERRERQSFKASTARVGHHARAAVGNPGVRTPTAAGIWSTGEAISAGAAQAA